ncbi:hypothetical protein [Bathymodiolus japonicus methanotrophic gill symbiont]|uniref:hypothetical protein n=1 Tax=Bathymodiolus japonicus methanotrophic gill symbiont TaxID=113269 RepID=UPI001C8D5C92|nr:hypothetical protein [Bathymodiolus japonicus methanotrophic gill symbiont]
MARLNGMTQVFIKSLLVAGKSGFIETTAGQYVNGIGSENSGIGTCFGYRLFKLLLLFGYCGQTLATL